MTSVIAPRARSWLFTPATRPDRFIKAGEAGADVLILDLEDAVAPADKDAAREVAMASLKGGADEGPRRALRINGLDTAAGIADIHALLGSGARPDYVVVPKTESDGHLRILDRLLSAAGIEARLVAIVESARGLASVDAIVRAAPRLVALMLGAADMSADLGMEAAWEPLLHVRSRLVLACAAGGILPVDSPYFDIRDTAGLARETRAAVAMGFQARAAIHPAQVGPINAALTPDREAAEWAERVMAENAKGVGTVDGVMVDEAIARRARRILAAAGQGIPDRPPGRAGRGCP